MFPDELPTFHEFRNKLLYIMYYISSLTRNTVTKQFTVHIVLTSYFLTTVERNSRKKKFLKKQHLKNLFLIREKVLLIHH